MVVEWQESRGSRRPGGPASAGNTASIDGLEQPVTEISEGPGASAHRRQPYSHAHTVPPEQHATKNQ